MSNAFSWIHTECNHSPVLTICLYASLKHSCQKYSSTCFDLLYGIILYVCSCISEPVRGVLHYTSRSPCGVVAIIVPWNLPLYLLTFKLAPALVHGNTVVAKPSEFTSLTAWMLCSVLREAGENYTTCHMTQIKIWNFVWQYSPETKLMSFRQTKEVPRYVEKHSVKNTRLVKFISIKNSYTLFTVNQILVKITH